MDNECEICGKEETLCDAVYENRPVRVCSYCKTLPEMLLIEKPSEDKLNRVYQRYTFSARAKQEIKDRKSESSASSPINFRGYTLDELRKKRQEREVQKKPEIPASSKTAVAESSVAKSSVAETAVVESEDLDFKPKNVRITGLQELKDEFDSV
jgi:hypothetical protein